MDLKGAIKYCTHHVFHLLPIHYMRKYSTNFIMTYDVNEYVQEQTRV